MDETKKDRRENRSERRFRLKVTRGGVCVEVESEEEVI